jgi:hypothetical protein
MNLEQLRTKLLAAARTNSPSDRVPFAFEKRIMARLAKPIADAWDVWAQALWRAAMACVVAMVLLGGWSLQIESTESTDFSQDFEETVFAAIDEQSEISIGEETW